MLSICAGGECLNVNYEQQFKKGALEMVLLAIISQKRTYGYEIILTLNRAGAPVFSNIKEGTLYPVLYRLEDAGLVSSELSGPEGGGRVKKYYVITEAGKKALRDMAAFWESYKVCIDRLMEG